jgi:hypothetical protein
MNLPAKVIQAKRKGHWNRDVQSRPQETFRCLPCRKVGIMLVGLEQLVADPSGLLVSVA